MATITGNFSLGRLSNLEVSNGDTLLRCNFTQAQPHTAICEGVTGLTFEKCNLGNCDVPGDAVITDCNTAQLSRCAHLHPHWGLPAEDDDCDHVVDTDEVWIDGELVDTIYHYQDTGVE